MVPGKGGIKMPAIFGIELWLALIIPAAAILLLRYWLGASRRDGRGDGSLSGIARTSLAKPAPPRASIDTMALAQIPEPQRSAIAAALAKGNKIEAIKLLRGARGLGLREAKDAIEAITRR
jgi:Ribosomal protein L7/L12 C-terminal domain